MTTFHYDIFDARTGEYTRVQTADHRELDHVRESRPQAGYGRRIVRADRAKPLPKRLPHSIKITRALGEPCSYTVGRKAKLMAEHIRRTGQTDIPLFSTERAAWLPRGVPSSVREFNHALLAELGERRLSENRQYYVTGLPAKYRVITVDPAEYAVDAQPEMEESLAA